VIAEATPLVVGVPGKKLPTSFDPVVHIRPPAEVMPSIGPTLFGSMLFVTTPAGVIFETVVPPKATPDVPVRTLGEVPGHVRHRELALNPRDGSGRRRQRSRHRHGRQGCES